MPWRVKRLLYLYACGFGALMLAVIVLVRDTNLDTELLGWLGILAGAGLVLNNLPTNGDGDEHK